MLKRILILVAIGLLPGYSFSQGIAAYSAEALVQRVSAPDTVYIVNFWATWCIPCIKELPEFAALDDRYKDKPVKVIMVSCNLKEEYPDVLRAYVAQKNIRQEVVWLSDTDIDHYRPVIDENWSGQIPSTIIFDNPRGQRHILEEVTTAAEVEDIIE